MNKLTLPTAKKILFLAAVISVAGHVFIISAVGLMVSGGGSEASRPFMIQLREPPDKAPMTKPQAKSQPVPQEQENAEAVPNEPEDTVELGDRESKYIPYLKRTRDKIKRLWVYPRPAFEKQQEGDVMVRFSINKNGRLSHSRIEQSSGFAALDQNALDVIRRAAPFPSFSADMKISRLHIYATFKYRIDE
jgi:protein TonB